MLIGAPVFVVCCACYALHASFWIMKLPAKQGVGAVVRVLGSTWPGYHLSCTRFFVIFLSLA
jgi:hypothetical protein